MYFGRCGTSQKMTGDLHSLRAACYLDTAAQILHMTCRTTLVKCLIACFVQVRVESKARAVQNTWLFLHPLSYCEVRFKRFASSSERAKTNANVFAPSAASVGTLPENPTALLRKFVPRVGKMRVESFPQRREVKCKRVCTVGRISGDIA